MSVGTRIIHCDLSEREIDRASKELKKYKQELIHKTALFRKRLAEQITSDAQNGFVGAIVDDVLKGEKRVAKVTVTFTSQNNVSTVIASGEDAVWVEFGAGVYHNGSAGTSPHPSGVELGMTIGGYGKGQGKKSVWGFYEDGELRLSHGAPATMPMYKAVKIACDNIANIAKEVFI